MHLIKVMLLVILAEMFCTLLHVTTSMLSFYDDFIISLHWRYRWHANIMQYYATPLILTSAFSLLQLCSIDTPHTSHTATYITYLSYHSPKDDLFLTLTKQILSTKPFSAHFILKVKVCFEVLNRRRSPCCTKLMVKGVGNAS